VNLFEFNNRSEPHNSTWETVTYRMTWADRQTHGNWPRAKYSTCHRHFCRRIRRRHSPFATSRQFIPRRWSEGWCVGRDETYLASSVKGSSDRVRRICNQRGGAQLPILHSVRLRVIKAFCPQGRSTGEMFYRVTAFVVMIAFTFYLNVCARSLGFTAAQTRLKFWNHSF